jgi:hypothetical protein
MEMYKKIIVYKTPIHNFDEFALSGELTVKELNQGRDKITLFYSSISNSGPLTQEELITKKEFYDKPSKDNKCFSGYATIVLSGESKYSYDLSNPLRKIKQLMETIEFDQALNKTLEDIISEANSLN